MKRPSLWISLGVLLLLLIAVLKLAATVGPGYVYGRLMTRPGSSTLANFPAGLRFYAEQIQKDSGLSLGSIYYRLVFSLATSVALVVVAIFLALRKAWAWKGLVVVLAVLVLNFMVWLAAAVLRNPSGVSLKWLSNRVSLDLLVTYLAILLIFGSRPVRAVYGLASEQPGR